MKRADHSCQAERRQAMIKKKAQTGDHLAVYLSPNYRPDAVT
jgi:hypothetical protein